MSATYWLAAGARGIDDLPRALGAAVAGWVRAGTFGARGEALRDDLDRLIVQVILPERAQQLAFGADPHGKSKRKDQGEEGRFRKFTREEIRARGDNLDIAWLRDESSARAEDLPDPDAVAEQIAQQLERALGEMKALRELLAEK